ncbi:MAG: replication-associated recombination protein A [Gemmatimonadota bacterium]
MSHPDLFPEESQRAKAPKGQDGDSPGAAKGVAPLAARMRPRALDEFRGQDHLIGPGRPLNRLLEAGRLPSLILWGPPGSGKTTLAHLLARASGETFVAFSAVTEGVARVREIIAEAKDRRRAGLGGTVLFCDEIHRFNKAQQDAFLPHVEDGTVTLVGATTENPSFQVVRPLLSRSTVLVLEPLSPEALEEILHAAILDEERGLGGMKLKVEGDALRVLASAADGDARRGLGVLESAAQLAGPQGTLTPDGVREAIQHRFALYDREGEEHYNLVSALHKSIRGSDPQGALYWLARMLEGGEEPLYLARRLIRMATEDVGLADPGALEAVVAAWQAYHFLGSPEGELALAQATVHLATAPKSNRLYRAWGAARAAARETGGEGVPLHLRNAPTALMRELGYGAEYRYEPDEEHGVSSQSFLPPALEGTRFYEPGPFGFEKEIRKRLEWWEAKRDEKQRKTSPEEGHSDGGSG